MKFQKKYFVAAAVFAAWLALAVGSYDIGFFTKAVVQFFASGRSLFKDYFFLFWSCLSFTVLGFGASWFKDKRQTKSLVFTSIAALAVLNIFSHVLFSYLYNIKLFERVLAVSRGITSSNVCFHTHTMKPMLFPFVGLLGLNSILTRTDPGVPYYDLLPHWLFFLGLGLFAVLLVSTMQLLIQKAKEWPSEKRWALIFVYVISSYTIAKSFFDGGILSGEFVTYLPAFLVVVGFQDGGWLLLVKKYLKFLTVGVAGGAIFYASHKFSDLHILFGQVGMFMIFPIFVYLLAVQLSNKNWRLTPLTLVFLILLFVSSKGFFWANTFRRFQTEITPQNRVYVMDFNGREKSGTTKVYEEGNLAVRMFTPTKVIRVWDVYKANRIPPDYGRVVVSGIGCMEGIGYMAEGDVISVGQFQPKETNSNLFNFFNLTRISDQPPTFHYKVGLKGCVPDDAEYSILHHLTEMGMEKFIMIPAIRGQD